MRRRTFVAALGGAVICPLAASAQQTDNDAATFPNRPIKIVVLFPQEAPRTYLPG
jgi:hypothetical protein